MSTAEPLSTATDGPAAARTRLVASLRDGGRAGEKVARAFQAVPWHPCWIRGIQLAVTEPDLSRLTMMGRHEGHASQAQRRIAMRMPLGGFAGRDVDRDGNDAGNGRLGVAALAVPAGTGRGDHPVEVAVHGYGPGGAALAAHLAARAIVWDELGTPGAATLLPAVRRRRNPGG